jgi:hypothetical protein
MITSMSATNVVVTIFITNMQINAVSIEHKNKTEFCEIIRTTYHRVSQRPMNIAEGQYFCCHEVGHVACQCPDGNSM